jgi:hypothetical protein
MLFAGPATAQDIEARQDAPAEREVSTHLPLAAIFLGSLGAITVAVGAGFGWQADQEYDDYNAKPTEELADDVEMHAIVADVLMFTGGAAVIGSALWWWLGYDDDETAHQGTGASAELSAARWRAIVGPGQAGLTIEF